MSSLSFRIVAGACRSGRIIAGVVALLAALAPRVIEAAGRHPLAVRRLPHWREYGETNRYRES
jgi:hypothetical protein